MTVLCDHAGGHIDHHAKSQLSVLKAKGEGVGIRRLVYIYHQVQYWPSVQ